MDYEASAAQQKRINRIYNEFMIDIIRFQQLSEKVVNGKVDNEEHNSICNYLPTLLDQIALNAPDAKEIFSVLVKKDEVTGTATRI